MHTFDCPVNFCAGESQGLPWYLSSPGSGVFFLGCSLLFLIGCKGNTNELVNPMLLLQFTPSLILKDLLQSVFDKIGCQKHATRFLIFKKCHFFPSVSGQELCV